MLKQEVSEVLLRVIGDADAGPQAAVITHKQADSAAGSSSWARDTPSALDIDVHDSSPP